MPSIPRDSSYEDTLALLKDPYRFISRKCRQLRSDLFQTRLMLRKTICMTGREAARLFYDETRFTRSGAAPLWLQKTLFGQSGLQVLDGHIHQHRKRAFMSLMTPERIDALNGITMNLWDTQARRWVEMGRIVLYRESAEILTRAVCSWSGIPLPEADVPRRSEDLIAMFDQAAGFGRGHIRSRWARLRSERWIGSVIDDIRAGRHKPPAESAAHVIAWYRDPLGQLLDRRVAAVEMLNILRPTVAVSVFIVFTALALHQHPKIRQRLQHGNDKEYAELFAQEIRRYYPFFPAVMARVRHDFFWQGYAFPQGRRVMLDLYGTNHDPRLWSKPEEFNPERFRRWKGDPFSFIPQGGGDYEQNHRCPGENIAIELIRTTALFLASRITYDVPEQNLEIDFSRLPALPGSGFILNNVRMRPMTESQTPAAFKTPPASPTQGVWR